MGQRIKDSEYVRQHAAAYLRIRWHAAVTTFIGQPRLQLWMTSERWMAERFRPELIVDGLPCSSVGSAPSGFVVKRAPLAVRQAASPAPSPLARSSASTLDRLIVTVSSLCVGQRRKSAMA